MRWIVMVIFVGLLAGCSNSDQANDGQSTQADVERYEALMDKYDEQTVRADAQLDRTKKHADRYEALLKRWEEQADRYDAILKKWEAQSNPKE